MRFGKILGTAAMATAVAASTLLIASPAEAANSGSWSLQPGVRGAKAEGTWKKRSSPAGWVDVRGTIKDTEADSKRAYVKGVADYNGLAGSVHFEYEADGGSGVTKSFLITGDLASVWIQECVDNRLTFEICSPVEYVFKKSW